MLSDHRSLVLCLLASAFIHVALVGLAPVGLPDNARSPISRPTALIVTPYERHAQSGPAIATYDANETTDAPTKIRDRTSPEAPRSRSEITDITELYLPPSQLSTIPHPIDSLSLSFPQESRYSLVGDAELMLLLSSEGRVDAVLTIRSTLPAPMLGNAINAFSNARFTPGYVNQTPVRSRIRIQIAPDASPLTEAGGNPLSAKQRESK